MQQIWSNDFLEDLKSKYERNKNHLTQLAYDRDQIEGYIVQVRKMWSSLPSNLRQKKLYSDLHTGSDGGFNGAFAELISAWILSKYFLKVSSEINVGGQTPDFYCENETNSYIFETYTLGKGHEEKTFTNNLINLQDEIKNVKSKYFIFLQGKPRPCKKNGFSGLKNVLQKYLDDLKNPSDDLHTVVFNNGSISFYVEKGDDIAPVYFGWMGDIENTDKNKEKLIYKMTEKKEKYIFPHVQICVADSSLFTHTNTLITTLVGNQRMHIDRKSHQHVGSSYTNDGFWGMENSDFSNNLHVQGLLFITRKFNSNNELELKLSLAENYHLKSGLNKVFENIPSIFGKDFDEKNILSIVP